MAAVKSQLWLVSALLVALPVTSQASSTWRCGSALVSLNDTAGQVANKCGEPRSQELVGYREISDDYGFRHEVEVQEWSYGPNNGMYHYLRFEGNRLVKIDSKRGN
ncbi:DUF2845 domain-containing protein [Pseudomonas sp. 5P_3.1_Bac2]|uniref:DUF2845 domain-containing protein n=1 Tax=Pseudomonas sp. 5P_3.1_Bac2 TaxID=2971617 RepID=UPI0021C661FB|nr:DUF2845 domain-containing protein [Pseudomonas sp. 5P_3.1_Bac2]MCU1718796.1 DUF2845 domain-containing protein [Pseudomonas sp. 5P_3.1_Bac2]